MYYTPRVKTLLITAFHNDSIPGSYHCSIISLQKRLSLSSEKFSWALLYVIYYSKSNTDHFQEMVTISRFAAITYFDMFF